MTEFENQNAEARNRAIVPFGREGAAAESLMPYHSGNGWAPAGPAAPSASGSPLAFDSLLKAFRNRWLLASSMGLLLGLALGTAGWFLAPPKYTAYALLKVAPAEPQLLADYRAPAVSDQNYQNTQVALLKSRSIITSALRPAEVSQLPLVREKEDPVFWLEEDLNVGFYEKADLLKVALSSNSYPNDLPKIVNSVTDAYMKQEVDGQRAIKQREKGDLDKVLSVKEEDLRQAREQLANFAKNLKSADSRALTARQTILLNDYGTVTGVLTHVDAEIWDYETKLDVLNGKLEAVKKASAPAPLVDQALDADPAYRQKEAEFKAEESKIMAEKRKLLPNSSSAARYDGQLKEARDSLDATRAERVAAVTKRVREAMRAELQNHIDECKLLIKTKKLQQVMLASKVKEKKELADSVGYTSFELENKRTEIEHQEGLIRELRQRRDHLGVELQSTNQRVSKYQEAERPQRHEYQKTARVAGFLGFLGLFLGSFLVSYREARVRRINTAADVVGDLNVRVLGVIPALDASSHYGSSDNHEERDSLLLESVDGVRAMLLCGVTGESHRLLMVTSASAREGKTTLASHLAISLARSGKRVLLIDADLRRPTLHQVFEVPMGPGFSDVLRGEMTIEQAVRPLPISGLDFMGAGNDPRLGVTLLPRKENRAIFEKLREMYDIIIVDSSPVLPVADSLWLGKLVDGVVLSVRSQTSRAPTVHAAYERLKSINVPVLGAVVNGVRNYLHIAGYDYFSQSELALPSETAAPGDSTVGN
jgi:capsular exopolysaccharide synthesis family protein